MLIAPRFFGYELEIERKLISLGAVVHFFDQRPSNSFITKALIRLNKRFLSSKIDRYYTRLIIDTKKNSYDYILFINPEAVTKYSMGELKKAQPQAQFIVYMWDSLRNKRFNIEDILPFFDERFSFDKKDCESSAWKIRYRPLFFLNEYATIRRDTEKQFELLFIGTIHSDRHKVLMALKDFCEAHKLPYFYYMFFPSKFLYYLSCLIHTTVRKAKKDSFEFQPLKKNEILELIEKSNVVIDIEHPNQSGLTIRTIEVLGAGRKLITTNEDIVNYDFFNPQNILLIDRKNVTIDISFFETPVSEIPQHIYQKYSIDGWISEIFEKPAGS